MRIAIIGTGISGMAAAYLLSKKHEVVVYEKSNRLGGHTATKEVNVAGKAYSIDTGFIVFNDWTYPNFKKLLAELNVEYQPAPMGFSVACDKTGLEYSGDSLNTLFAQRRNIFKRSHWQMLRDILRFNKEAIAHLDKGGDFLSMTLGDYLHRFHYSEAFMDKYLLPMGAAIWSSSLAAMKDFPLQFFVRFFKNHGLLSVNDRPQWHVIKGGSKQYIGPLTAGYESNIRLNSAVQSIRRYPDNVSITTMSGDTDTFDQVVVACHSNEALSLLADATPDEQSVLGNMHYRTNEVILHTDESVLPKNRLAWSSWNYRIPQDKVGEAPIENQRPVLTYNMNLLQSLQASPTFCVTLNRREVIDSKKILGTYHYSHPVFTLDMLKAQLCWKDINGVNNTWFCGAYWFNGFHEDGVKSAARVAEALGIEW